MRIGYGSQSIVGTERSWLCFVRLVGGVKGRTEAVERFGLWRGHQARD